MIHEFVKLTFQKFKQQGDPELYKKLIKEEVEEFFEAKTLGEQVNEAVDILWVTIGWLISTIGYDNTLKAYKTVFQSNMSKICWSEKEAIETVDKYKNKGVDCIYKKFEDDDGVYWIVYDMKGKYKKGINFKKSEWSWLS